MPPNNSFRVASVTFCDSFTQKLWPAAVFLRYHFHVSTGYDI